MAESLGDRRERPWWKRLEENVLILHTLTTLAGIFAGVALEGHADEVELLVKVLRPDYLTGAPLWHGYWFVLLVAITLGLSVRSFIVQDRLRRDDETRRKSAESALLEKSSDLLSGTKTLLSESREMRIRTDELLKGSAALAAHTAEVLTQQADIRKLVQTMPPANFVNAYVEYVIAVQGVWNDLLEEATFGDINEDAVKQGIRVVLKAVAEMFKVYDNAAEDTHVAANLMLFIPRELFDKSRMEGERAVEMAFGSDGQQWRSLSGVLLLHPALSARAGGEPDEPDRDIKKMYFPVPIDQKVRGPSRDLWTVLPGAPLAWVSRVPTSHPSPAALLQWCEQEAALPREVHDKLARYLKNTPAVHSFVSIPFPESPDSPPLAVLNVHSSAPGLLEGKDKQLLVLVKPITAILKCMIELLSELRSATGRAAQLDVARELQEFTQPKFGGS
ncbi:MAG TPA: hypothetical protein VF615_28100 [Longimicrobiaceae bacterium]|jgi:hypothetical protein